jgi:hypothetical protein
MEKQLTENAKNKYLKGKELKEDKQEVVVTRPQEKPSIAKSSPVREDEEQEIDGTRPEIPTENEHEEAADDEQVPVEALRTEWRKIHQSVKETVLLTSKKTFENLYYNRKSINISVCFLCSRCFKRHVGRAEKGNGIRNGSKSEDQISQR